MIAKILGGMLVKLATEKFVIAVTKIILKNLVKSTKTKVDDELYEAFDEATK